MEVEVFGPIEGTFLCQLPAGSEATVAAARTGDTFSDSPEGEPVTTFTANGKDRYFLLKQADEPGDVSKGEVTMAINGKVVSVKPRPDAGAIQALEEMFANVGDNQEKMEGVQQLISSVEGKLLNSSRKTVEVLLNSEGNKKRAERIKKIYELKLRSLKQPTKSNKGLLRRFGATRKPGEALPLTATKLNEMRKMLEEIEETEETDKTDELKVCFLSHESSLQGSKDAVDVLMKENANIEDVPLQNLVSMFGLVGIPVCHELQNFTDPMNMGVNDCLKEVVASDQCHLSQRSLWDLSGTKGNETLAQPFGFKSKVTAVVPIKAWNHPEVWKAFTKTSNLGKFLISAQLRGTGTPLPDDQSALTTAALLRTIEDWPEPSQTQASLMAQLLDTIQYKEPSPPNVKNLMDFPDHYIINNTASALEPLVKIVQSSKVLGFAGSDSEECKKLWRAVVSNSIYWRVRRNVHGENKRKQKLLKIVDTEKQTIDGNEIENIQESLDVYAKLYQIARKFRSEPTIKDTLFQNNHDGVKQFESLIAGYNIDLWMAVEATKALLCKKSTWRLKKQRCPYPQTEEEAWDWLKSVHVQQSQPVFLPDRDMQFEDFLSNLNGISIEEFAAQMNTLIPNEFDKFVDVTSKSKKRFKVGKVVEQMQRDNQKTVDKEEKLTLTLYGKFEAHRWREGEVLRNAKIAGALMESLAPLIENNVEKKAKIDSLDEHIEETNQFVQHWYRTKGSRKGYNNDRLSFWAVTGYTEPWSFIKRDKINYIEFQERLKSFAHDGNQSKKNFYEDWKHLLDTELQEKLKSVTNQPKKQLYAELVHLLKKNPLSMNTSLRKKEHHLKPVAIALQVANCLKEFIKPQLSAKLLSIFPHPKDNSFGLNHLMEKMEISQSDLQNFSEESFGKVASNWKLVLKKILPEKKLNELDHSINEIFDLDETFFKAAAAYHVLGNSPEINGKRQDLIEAINSAAAVDKDDLNNENVLDIEDIVFTDEQMKMLQKHYILILERLLPLRAHELRSAVENVFKGSQVFKMAATYHILQRYMSYGLTTMGALHRLLDDEDLILSTKPFLSAHEEMSIVHPSVTFELKYDMNGKTNKKEIRKTLVQALKDIQTKEHLILWLNMEFKRRSSANNWEPLETLITKEELMSITVSVEDIWYGGLYHSNIIVDFNYQNFNSDTTTEEKERKRLRQLKHFFHLALENMYQIVPSEGEFVFDGKTYESTEKVDDSQVLKHIEYKVKALWGGMQQHQDKREEAASIFETLGKQGVQFNKAEQIFNLLNTTPSDIDNLTITIQKTPDMNCKVNVIESGPIFIHPERQQKFNEVPEHIFKKVHQLMAKELVEARLTKEVLDRLINVNEPSLFECSVREQLIDELCLLSPVAVPPMSQLTKFLNKLRDIGGTFGGLMDGFTSIKKATQGNISEVMLALVDGVDTIMREAKVFCGNEAKKKYSSSKTLDSFITFLKENEEGGNAMKRYAKVHGKDVETFKAIVQNRQVLCVGDMIFFYRKAKGVEYAHAAIYAPTEEEQVVVHIQPETKFMNYRSCEVQKTALDDVYKKKDKVFFVRACSNRRDQERVLERVHACLEPDPIKYTYNGFFGSCQTFCTKIFDLKSLEDLNPEAFNTCLTGMKYVASKFFSSNLLKLVREMDERFAAEEMVTFDLGSRDDDSLLRTLTGQHCSRFRTSRFQSTRTNPIQRRSRVSVDTSVSVS